MNPQVEQYHEWKSAVDVGTTNMDFDSWRVAQVLASLSVASCGHPFWAVRIQPGWRNRLVKRPIIECTLCQSNWASSERRP